MLRWIVGLVVNRAISFLTAVIAVITAYEIVAADRSLPTYLGVFNVCDATYPDDQRLNNLQRLISSNHGSLIYLDVLLLWDCGDQTVADWDNVHFEHQNGAFRIELSDRALHFYISMDIVDQHSPPHQSFYVNTNVRQPLSFYGDPGYDVDGRRLRGIFFLQGENVDYLDEFELQPVPFSVELLRLHICSEALANSRGLVFVVPAYIGSCIFQRRWEQGRGRSPHYYER